jgi:hypothetical protein
MFDRGTGASGLEQEIRLYFVSSLGVTTLESSWAVPRRGSKTVTC